MQKYKAIFVKKIRRIKYNYIKNLSCKTERQYYHTIDMSTKICSN